MYYCLASQINYYTLKFSYPYKNGESFPTNYMIIRGLKFKFEHCTPFLEDLIVDHERVHACERNRVRGIRAHVEHAELAICGRGVRTQELVADSELLHSEL
jgi:hypothetical protein